MRSSLLGKALRRNNPALVHQLVAASEAVRRGVERARRDDRVRDLVRHTSVW
ncbi:hypothetical protein [Kibdelosporangium phytohabitans]|uniref:hypothetical protein n=1 Tax=Kibdelosporangium phytohabitans TaxID=860235 RepID=UPI0019EA69C8|nr:hypothetical protein [Kibdelosporangium phytohabitans]MBE1469672.1 hypothetical protein [Kibdelosporangium phytohabitans]